jgi:cell division septum initiation protein DivIVA
MAPMTRWWRRSRCGDLRCQLAELRDSLQDEFTAVRAQLEMVSAKLDGLKQGQETQMAAIDDLETEVKANGDAEDSAITLLNGLHQQLQDALNSGDPARIQAAVQALHDKRDALAAAVVANTPAATA